MTKNRQNFHTNNQPSFGISNDNFEENSFNNLKTFYAISFHKKKFREASRAIFKFLVLIDAKFVTYKTQRHLQHSSILGISKLKYGT